MRRLPGGNRSRRPGQVAAPVFTNECGRTCSALVSLMGEWCRLAALDAAIGLLLASRSMGDFAGQPSLGKVPIPMDTLRRDMENRRNLIRRKPPEIAHFHHLCFARILVFE